MILIGQDNIQLTVPRKKIQGPEHLPVATKTHLGWKDECEKKYCFHICENEISDEILHQIVKDSITLDAFGVSTTARTKKDKENDRAVEVMKRTVNHIGERYEI
ncbi:hypothetical protein JTB14_001123 [Gonioctena quinquepunctata]|nr:hypothetical protein JTB14_001123 [Gonioctena quinquepunctata]